MLACPLCLAKVEQVDRSTLVSRLADSGIAVSDWRKVFAFWIFDKQGLIQILHHAWKYGGDARLGIQLGILLGKALVSRQYVDPVSPRSELLVPIPLSRIRILERGYNQSDLLTRGVARVTRQQVVENALVRTRPTRSQVGLTLENRRQNVYQAFRVTHNRLVADKHVWLVDDVITTGATLWAATSPLILAGAASVSILTLSAARMG